MIDDVYSGLIRIWENTWKHFYGIIQMKVSNVILISGPISHTKWQTYFCFQWQYHGREYDTIYEKIIIQRHFKTLFLFLLIIVKFFDITVIFKLKQ